MRIVALFIGLLLAFLFSLQREQPSKYVAPITLRYSAIVSNESSLYIENAKVFLYAPTAGHAPPPLLSTTPASSTTRDTADNTILEFSLSIPPYGKQVIAVQAEVSPILRAEGPNVSPYLRHEPLIESEAPSIKKLAETLRRVSAQETARATYEWVSSNLTDSGFYADDRGALWALDNRKGDCTEYSSLAAALLRANGIPARRIGGFVAHESSVLKPERYHNWVEFYDRAEWRVLDAQKRVFDVAAGYIPFRILDNSTTASLPNSHRFLSGDSRLKISLE